MGRNILAMGRRNELMWAYEKRLQYPIDIKTKDLKMAKYLVTQYGGANGELSAALRYLNQRYTMPDNRGKAILTDIGTEEYFLSGALCLVEWPSRIPSLLPEKYAQVHLQVNETDSRDISLTL